MMSKRLTLLRMHLEPPGRDLSAANDASTGLAHNPTLASDLAGEADDLEVTPADASAVQTIAAWAKALGWNSGAECDDLTLFVKPTELLVGKVRGEPVAHVAAVRFDDRHGWVGMLMVEKPENLGKGYALKMWRAAIRGNLRGTTVVGLDAVEAQRLNYLRNGFTHEAWNVTRQSGLAQGVLDAPCPVSAAPDLLTVEPVPPTDARAVRECVRFDREHIYPEMDRSEFMTKWFTRMPSAYTVLAREVATSKVVGVGQVRRAVSGHRVGPLFATSEVAMDAILRALARHVVDIAAATPSADDSRGVLHIDMPEAHTACAARYGLVPAQGFTCKRMYYNQRPAQRVENEYGVVCWELTF